MAIKPCCHPSGANQVPARISAIEIAAVNQMSAIARLLDFFVCMLLSLTWIVVILAQYITQYVNSKPRI